MTTKLIAELESLARQSDDAALAEEVVAQTFRPMFHEAFDQPRTQESFRRATELRNYVFDREANARRLRREAETFRAAIAAIQGATS